VSSNGRRDEVVSSLNVRPDDQIPSGALPSGRADLHGDLTVEIKPKSEKDVLGNAFATMRDKLRKVTAEIQKSVHVLTSSASEILAALPRCVWRVRNGRRGERTTTTVKRSNRRRNSRIKRPNKSPTAHRRRPSVPGGKKSVEESVEVMNRIRQQMESIAESIVRLSEQSQAIGESSPASTTSPSNRTCWP